jgi:hypothetical protein
VLRKEKKNHANPSARLRPRALVQFMTSLCVLTGVLIVSSSLTSTALAATSPTVTIKPVGTVTSTTAQVSGTVNPNGSLTTTLWNFQYSKDPETEGWTPSALSGIALAAEEVKGVLEGLQPNTPYQVRLVATNEEGGEGISAEPNPKFTTKAAPPAVSAESVSAVTATGATLEAQVNPNNETTTYSFEYSETESGGKLTGTIVKVPGMGALEGGTDQIATVPTGALSPDTTYYYRVVAENAQSIEEHKPAEGQVEHFETAPEAPETIAPAAGIAEIESTTAVLHGVLNPHAAATDGWYFSYAKVVGGLGSCQGFHSYGHESEPVDTPLEPEGTAQNKTVATSVAGLEPDTNYDVCLVARNKTGETVLGSQISFTTTGASNVGSSSATLNAQVDPGGTATSYFFEYGPTEAYGSKTALESAGAGAEPVGVLANIENLQPDTAYDFRVVAKNADGEVRGGDGAFSTLPVALSGLPDERGYEIVSPLNNGDAEVVPVTPNVSGENTRGARAAANGGAVTYQSTTPLEGGAGKGEPPLPGEKNVGVEADGIGDNQYLARRSGGSGWTATDIQPPAVKLVGYDSFSSDLSEAIIGSLEPLTENAPPNKYSGLYSRSTVGGGIRPLFTRTPSHLAFPEEFASSYAGASADGAHQLFEANDALLEGATLAAEELNAFASKEVVHFLYDSAGGQLFPVDVLPNGQVAPQASYGSPGSGEDRGLAGRLDHVISADGSRIFWSTEEAVEILNSRGEGTGGFEERPTALYIRENDIQPDASTTLIAEGARYQTASSDGSKVYFTDEKDLTPGANAALGAPDLYEAELSTIPGAAPTLTDLTSRTSNTGEHANVVGVLGASEDGAYVYFAAAGALAPGAKPQECIEPEFDGRTTFCDVYAVHVGEAPRFVAAVTDVDGEGGVQNALKAALPLDSVIEKKEGDWVSNIGFRTAQVTPDGRHLVFESIADLTGFDGGGAREIYMYDFGSGLSCVSCNPAGAPTLRSEAKYVSTSELSVSFVATYALRDLSTSGNRVFFNSKEALVPDDENKRTDVYEWERAGEGTCTATQVSREDSGCIYLLSGGTSSDYSAFLDASESGNDVFIQTRAQLAPQDHGEMYELYDARVGAPREPAPPVCTGAGCQGVPGAPPIFATPSSVTFDGVGNFPPPSAPVSNTARIRAQKLTKALRACRKKSKKKARISCEKQARVKYGPALRAKKAGNDKGAK